MATNFPSSLDNSTTIPVESAATKLSVNHVTAHQNIQDALEAVEAKIGVDGSAVTTSHDYKLSEVISTDKAVGKTATQTLLNKTLGTGTAITLGSDAEGDTYYRNSGGGLTKLARGTDNYIYKMNGNVPNWEAETVTNNASETVAGIVEEATQTQANLGTDIGETGAKLFIPPSKIANALRYQNIGAKTISSGENLSANVPVYINQDDSSVYTAHGFKETESTTTFTDPTTVATFQMAKLSDTQFMKLYSNGANTLSIAIFDKTAPTTAVDTETVSTTYSGAGPTIQTATMARLSDTTFVVFYTNTTNSSLRFRTGSISGSTITMDTDTAYSGSPDYCYGVYAKEADANGKVVLSYGDDTTTNGNSGTITATLSYLTVSTNSVTVTYSTNYTVSSSSYWATMQWSTCCFSNGVAYGLYSIGDAGGAKIIKYNFINVKNGNVGAGYETPSLQTYTGAGGSPTYSNAIPSFSGHNGKAYFGYTLAGNQSIIELSQGGALLKYQNSIDGATALTETTLKLVGTEAGVIVWGIGYQNTHQIYIQRDKIYSIFGTTKATTTYQSHDYWYKNTKDEVVFFDGATGTTIKTWKLPTPVDGFVTNSVTAPALATVYDKTVTTSGLTANAQYFLKDSYTTVGDMDFSGVIPVGKALSTTYMNLN